MASHAFPGASETGLAAAEIAQLWLRLSGNPG
jgi:hypothetical protein